MKHFKIKNYAAYNVLEDGTVVSAETGKKVKVTKGNMKLTNDAGTVDDVATADVQALLPAAVWVDDAPTEAPADTRTPEQIAADAAKQLYKDTLKTLKANLATATAEMLKPSTNQDEIMARHAAMVAAQNALTAHEASHKPAEVLPTAAEQTILDQYDGVRSELDAAKANYDAVMASEGVADVVKKFRKGSKKGDSVASRAPHMSYELAQQIREAVSKGASYSEAAKQFGCSSAAVKMYCKYQQWKLRKGDTAFTPLVNEYYPDGAPYFEDNVKETAEKYKLPADRKAPATA